MVTKHLGHVGVAWLTDVIVQDRKDNMKIGGRDTRKGQSVKNGKHLKSHNMGGRCKDFLIRMYLKHSLSPWS